MRDSTNIKARKQADDLTLAIYEQPRGFPREELSCLASQLRRAADSVPSNIAEGSSRKSKRDYLHFLHFARGSLSEAQCFLHLAPRLGYLSDENAERLSAQTKSTFAGLHGLIKAVAGEVGKFGGMTAAVTSVLVSCLCSRSPWSTQQWPVVL